MDLPYAKLRGRITEKFGTISNFAEALGTQKQQVSRKLRGGIGISRENVIEWCGVLEITSEDIGKFFYPEVQEKQN